VEVVVVFLGLLVLGVEVLDVDFDVDVEDIVMYVPNVGWGWDIELS